MSDDDSVSSNGDYDTGPGSTLEEITTDLNDPNTTIDDINGLFEWLSLRKSGTRATKISKILAVFNDGFPNVVRLARDCYHRENHRDANLLEGITTSGRTHIFNADNLLTQDLVYDEATGRWSNPAADSPSEPAPAAAADGSVTISASDFAVWQRRLADLESRGGAGGGSGLDETQVVALIEKSKKEARAELLSDIRDGREVVDTWATKDDRRQATAYELGPDFAVFNFERAPVRADTENCYDVSQSEESLRKLVFFSTIRDDDKKKILRRTALPSTWADPPSINPANRHKFSDAQLKRDKELRELQEKMLPTFQITVKALDLACRTHAECELLRDDIFAADGRDLVPRLDSIQQKLDDVIFGLSDDFHMHAQPVSGWQRERNNIVLQAKSKVGKAEVPDLVPPDKGTWYHDDGDVVVGAETLSLDELAARTRKEEKERLELARIIAGRGGHNPGPGGGRGGGRGGGGGRATASKSKKRRDKAKAKKNAAAAGGPAAAPEPAPAAAGAKDAKTKN
jgi:hypothetical protein